MTDTKKQDPIPTPPTSFLRQPLFTPYVNCPECDCHSFTLSDTHRGGTFHWGCDVCSTPWTLKVDQVFGVVMEKDTARKNPAIWGFALLKYRGGGIPQYIVVEDLTSGPDIEEREHVFRYRYDEGTCPTNYLKVELVSFGGDTDPHGLYEFKRFISNQELRERFDWSWKELASGLKDNDWHEIFPELVVPSEKEEPCTYPD